MRGNPVICSSFISSWNCPFWAHTISFVYLLCFPLSGGERLKQLTIITAKKAKKQLPQSSAANSPISLTKRNKIKVTGNCFWINETYNFQFFFFGKPYVARKTRYEIIQLPISDKSLNYLLLHTSYKKQSSLRIILQIHNQPQISNSNQLMSGDIFPVEKRHQSNFSGKWTFIASL